MRLENLKAIREQRGLTASELADKAGITRGAMSRIEGGSMGVTVRTLCAFAEALHCSTDALLGRDIVTHKEAEHHGV